MKNLDFAKIAELQLEIDIQKSDILEYINLLPQNNFKHNIQFSNQKE